MKKLHGMKVVDLDRAPRPPKGRPSEIEPSEASRRRPRRQCQFCFTNRSSILQWMQRDCEERALHALRLAHPEEFDELVQRERDAAEIKTEQSWQLHLANKCKRAFRIAGTATNHRHVDESTAN